MDNTGNAYIYTFISYIPNALGMFVARIFTESIFLQIYFARFFGLISFIILIYFSIKNMPFKKMYLCVLMFMPMVLQQSMSLNADALTITSSFLLVSLVLNLRYNDSKFLNKKKFILIFTMAIIISVSKIVYIPICLIVFLIPSNKFKSKKDRYIKLGSLMSVIPLANMGWYFILGLYPSINDRAGVSVSEQLAFILLNICFKSKYLEKYIQACFPIYELYG